MSRPPPVSYVLAGHGTGILLLHGLGGDHNQSLALLPDNQPGRRIAPDLVSHYLATMGPEAGAAAFSRTPEYEATERAAPVMASSLLGQFARPNAVDRRRVLAEIPSSLPLPDRDAYANLGVDTLVVAAPDHPVHNDQIARTLSSWIPNARLATVPRKLPDPTEHADAVQRTVAAFLRRRQPSRKPDLG